MTPTIGFGRDCARAWEEMPWMLQGSASQEQREWLMDHLAHCESCCRDFTRERRLQLALSLPTDVSVDADAGLSRLLARVDTADVEERRPGAGTAHRLTRALAAAVLIQALGIGVLGAGLWWKAGPQYHTLSQPPSTRAPAGALRVVPDAGMTLAGWDKLLHTLRLKVIGGPNDIGAYVVVPANATSSSAQILQQLRHSRDIRLAEPVDQTQ